VLMALRLVLHVCFRHASMLAQRLRLDRVQPLLEALERTKTFVLMLIAVWVGSQWLILPARAESFIRTAALTAVLVQAGLWAMTLLNGWLRAYRERQRASNPGALSSISAVGLLLKGALWICVLLVALDNFGINVTALVTGLGIGGVAVALAVQNILGDLFASLTIALDKPFVVGDFLILGDYMGTVEMVGLKNTRIRSLSGEQIILSNSDLLGSRIRNYGRMYERRVAVTVSVIYQTPRAQLEKIPGIIRAVIEAQPQTRFDRAHFLRYGAPGIEFEYVYFVTVAAFNTYMDINQAVNYLLHRRFEEEGILFAYPGQPFPPPPALKLAA
jgi:small-conductance mechanosensitive channel